MRISQKRPWGEVPPECPPRFPDFVLQLGFLVKWPHSKFDMKRSKPGGLSSTTELAFCDVPIYVAIVFRDVRVTSVSILSMLNKCVKYLGHSNKDT